MYWDRLQQSLLLHHHQILLDLQEKLGRNLKVRENRQLLPQTLSLRAYK